MSLLSASDIISSPIEFPREESETGVEKEGATSEEPRGDVEWSRRQTYRVEENAMTESDAFAEI